MLFLLKFPSLLNIQKKIKLGVLERDHSERDKLEREKMMIKLRSKRFSRSSSSNSNNNGGSGNNGNVTKGSCCGGMSEIKWELRPGGMLVQKRETGEKLGEAMITVRVSTGTQWHDIPIEATSTFGELKMVVSMVTGLEPIEQRLLFRGKEREDGEHLHMVGVGDKDKVLLLQDPAIKERKKQLLSRVGSGQSIGTSPFRTISV